MFKNTISRTVSAFTALTGHDDDGRLVTMTDAVLTPQTLEDSGAILHAIESFSRKRLFLMIMGRAKREFVAGVLLRKDARTVLDVGTYCGYSALGVVHAVPDAKVLSIEPQERYGDIARDVWTHAGIDTGSVILLRGRLSDPSTITAVRSELAHAPVDVVLLDHDKNCYLDDLHALIDAEVVGPGTTVIADNIRLPGVPEYRRFMRDHEGIDWSTEEIGLPHTVARPVRDIVLVSEYLASRQGGGAA